MYAPAASRRSATLALILSAALSAATVAALLWGRELPLRGLLRAWEGAAPGPLLAAVTVAAVSQLGLGPDKLRRVVLASGGALSWRTAAAMRLGSGPLRLVTPFRAGGLADIAFLHKYADLSAARAAGCLSFDRGLNLLGLLLWLLVGSLLSGGGAAAVLGAAAALAAVLAVFWVPSLHRIAERLAARLPPRLRGPAQGLLAPFTQLAPRRRAGLLVYGLAYQTSPPAVCWLLLDALGYPLDVARAMAYTSLSMLAGQLPGPLAGIGPREASLLAMIGPGAPDEVVLTAGLLLSSLISLLPRLVGLPWLPWYLHRIAAGEEAHEL